MNKSELNTPMKIPLWCESMQYNAGCSYKTTSKSTTKTKVLML